MEYIEHSGKGYVITASGLDFFNSHKEGFVASELKASAAYRKYKNIKVVDGFKMVPHLEEYYIDNLHPNGLGTEVYGRNLVEAIRKSGF